MLNADGFYYMNRRKSGGEIRRNQATIELAKFFSHGIVRSIGFERVTVLAIGLVRKGPSMIRDSTFPIYLLI